MYQKRRPVTSVVSLNRFMYCVETGKRMSTSLETRYFALTVNGKVTLPPLFVKKVCKIYISRTLMYINAITVQSDVII